MDNINLEQLYNQYKSQIYSLCIRLTMSKEFSEDLFADTWAKVAEKFSQLDPAQNSFNWIYTICLNIYRKEKLKRSFIRLFSTQTDYPEAIQACISVEDLLIEKEETIYIQSAIKKLKDKYRIPIILYYFKDLSYQDISEAMHLPLSTVKFRLNQAKKIIKTELEKDGYK